MEGEILDGGPVTAATAATRLASRIRIGGHHKKAKRKVAVVGFEPWTPGAPEQKRTTELQKLVLKYSQQEGPI